MAQEDAEAGGRDRAQVKVRTPWRGGPADGDRRLVRVYGGPIPFQRLETGTAQLVDDRPRLVILVVIAQDRELAQPGLERAEQGLDPRDRLVIIDDVPGEDEQIGLPAVAGVDHALEVPTLEARGHVQVAKLDDPEAVERIGEPGE